MQPLYPDYQTASFQDLFQFFTLRARNAGLNHLNPIYQGGLIDLPDVPNPALTDEPGYVYHVSILQAEPAVIRLFYVFCRNGTVEVRCPTYQQRHKVHSYLTWEEGVCKLFDKIAQTLEYVIGRSQGCARTIRIQTGNVEGKRVTVVPVQP